MRSIAGNTLDSSGYLFDPKDTSCDGLPQLRVGTMPGTCLGMVLPKSKAIGFIKPRTILQINGTKDFLVVDMGGWADNKGSLFLLTREGQGPYSLKLLKGKLNQPHGLALSSDGFYYLGEKTKISRFNYEGGILKNWQIVVANMQKDAGFMHPLSQFTFDPRNNDLYINSGSPSDHCTVQGKNNYKSCPETEMEGKGSILRVPGSKLATLPANGVRFFEVTAVGLRNSMAMAIHPSGTLVQGENSRDFPELEEPHEEINVIDLNNRIGLHYGWPYCYNFHATSPEWAFPENKNLPLHKQFLKPVDCTLKEPKEPGEYQAPHALMPPHVAPLHMAYYQGAMFPELQGQLLVSWHGYQPTGQRMVAYKTDSHGRPMLNEGNTEGSYGFNQKGAGVARRKFRPHGGIVNIAPYTEVISEWSAIKGVRPKGAPVGFTTADDGSIYIVEDRENMSIVRLAKSAITHKDSTDDKKDDLSADPRIEFLAWRHFVKSNSVIERGYANVQSQLIEKHCMGCHGNMVADDIAKDRFARLDFIVKNEWIVGGDKDRSKLYGAIAHLPAYTPMPPLDKVQFHGTPAGDQLIKQVGDWITALTPEIEKSYTRIVMSSSRNIRTQTNSTGTACGQLQSGDVVYVDQRSEHRPKFEGWVWTKVYLVPGHTRLFPGKCAYPEDGVYWVALVKQ